MCHVEFIFASSTTFMLYNNNLASIMTLSHDKMPLHLILCFILCCEPHFLCVNVECYKYLKRNKGQLPHPKGPLAKVMPSSATASANANVTSQGSVSGKG